MQQKMLRIKIQKKLQLSCFLASAADVTVSLKTSELSCFFQQLDGALVLWGLCLNSTQKGKNSDCFSLFPREFRPNSKISQKTANNFLNSSYAITVWKQIVTIFQMKKHFQKCFFILRMWLHCLTHK
ncbi:hypothetical protein ATANTOWER_016491 [Ataeniobius toweri]|uniref:Secreted protein n=1 Tax=Ataeniobius toweri TaxID=208326 RepID=A0ABU7CBP6_9TELE|nr:hypothetical protein [Ataeniobius toweri]